MSLLFEEYNQDESYKTKYLTNLLEAEPESLQAGGDVPVKQDRQVGFLRLDITGIDPALDIAKGGKERRGNAMGRVASNTLLHSCTYRSSLVARPSTYSSGNETTRGEVFIWLQFFRLST